MRTTYLMNEHTGAVDTVENWLAASKAEKWDFDTAELVEVDFINGTWVDSMLYFEEESD